MAQVAGFLVGGLAGAVPAWNPPVPISPHPAQTKAAWSWTMPAAGAPTSPGPVPPPRVRLKIGGLFDEREQLNPWFGMVHVSPKAIDEGRVLSQVNIEMSVHNAYRRVPVGWTGFANGAGEGSELTGSTPPQTIYPQASITDLVFVIGTDGVPVVDDVLTFTFGDGSVIEVPIAFSRLVFWPFFPEEGYTEELGFLTEVLTAKDGTEQRHSVRQYPRQRFRLEFREEGGSLTRLMHTLVGRPGATYGVPLWHEQTVLTSAVSAGDAVIDVQETAYRDFRVLGTAVVFLADGHYDIMQIQSLGATSITPVNPVVHDYPVGTIVMPIRLATTGTAQRGARWVRRAGRVSVVFDVKDTQVDLADDSGWDTLNGAVCIDDGNAAGQGGTVPDSVKAPLVVFDPEVGGRENFAFAAIGRHQSQKSWYPRGAAYLWKVRQLLHALRGRQVAWYLPSDRDGLVVTEDIVAGAKTFVVENAGLTYVAGHVAADYVRFVEANGTVTTAKCESGVASVDGLTETITTVGTFAANINAADIVRAMIIHKVRFDTDMFSIRYERGRPGARITAPVITVLDE